MSSSCPSEAILRDLLENRLGTEEDAAVAAHVETCLACQQVLEQLTSQAFKVHPTDSQTISFAAFRVGAASSGDLPLTEPPQSPSALDPVRALVDDRGPPPIPGFEVLAEVGRGGMGVVYQAHDLGTNRLVALKMLLHGDFATPDQLARFRLESELAARVQHPGVVQVYHVGTLGGRPYLSMEWIEGPSLGQVLKATPNLSSDDAARLMRQIAEATHAAHQGGVIHRDLKPANILLQDRGPESAHATAAARPLADRFVPKIADFGLARFQQEETELTQTGTLLGTPAYMAPELFRVGGKVAGPRSDVYSLGVMLYEMLTGRVPFQGASPIDLLLNAESGACPTPRELISSVPPDLEIVCLKAMAREPERRYATAGEFAEDLRRFLHHEPIHARQVGRWERLRLWAKRRPAIAALAASLAAALVLGFVGIATALGYALAGWDHAAHQERVALLARDEARQGQEREATLRGQAEAALYFSRIAQAELRWRANDLAAAQRLLAACPPARRGWEWRYLRGLLDSACWRANADQAPQQWHKGTGWVQDIAYTPDGTRLLSAGGGSLFDGDTQARVPSQILVWNAHNGTLQRKLPNVPRTLLQLAVSRDGHMVAALQDDGVIRRWRLDSGEEGPPLRDVESRGALRFAADNRLYFIGFSDLPPGAQEPRRVRFRLWDVDMGKTLWSQERADAFFKAAAFSGDGQRVAVSVVPAEGHRGWVQVYDVASGQCWHERELPGWAIPITLNATGDRLALFQDRLQVWPVGGTAPLWQAVESATPLALTFAPDGTTLAIGLADRSVRVRDAASGMERGYWRGHAGRVNALAYDPQGRRLACGSQQVGELLVWDLSRNQEALVLPDAPGAGRSAEGLYFADQGKTLVVASPGAPLAWVNLAAGQTARGHRWPLQSRWLTPASLVATTEDGRVVAGVVDGLAAVGVWDAAQGTEITRLAGLNAVIQRVAIDRTGKRVAAIGTRPRPGGGLTREVVVWELPESRVVWRLTFQTNVLQASLAMSPDGTHIALDSPVEVEPSGAEAPNVLAAPLRVINVNAGRTAWTAGQHRAVLRGLAFNHAGTRLIGGDARGHIILWDVQTGRMLAEVRNGPAEAFAFSPDGSRVAAADREQVGLLDASTLQTLLELGGLPPRPSDDGYNPAVVWSADGRRLAAIRHRGLVAVWDAAP